MQKYIKKLDNWFISLNPGVIFIATFIILSLLVIFGYL